MRFDHDALLLYQDESSGKREWTRTTYSDGVLASTQLFANVVQNGRLILVVLLRVTVRAIDLLK
jgi:hypothetical protein